MAFDIGSVVAHVKADITGFQEGIATAQKEASIFGDRIKDVAGTLEKMIVVGAAAAVGMAAIFTKQSIDAAANAQAEMSRVDALLKQTAADMKYTTVTIKGNTSALKTQTDAVDKQIEAKQRQLKVLVLKDKADSTEYDNIKKELTVLELQKIAIEDTTEVKDKSVKVVNKQALSQQQLRAEVDKLSASFIKLGFDDEETAQAMAKSLKVTKDLASSTKEMGLAADFARLQDIGIMDAQRLLQMAYMGNARVLKQYGIELEDNATKQEIFAKIQAVAGGQAEAYSTTYKGALAVMNVEFENLKETIGAAFLPTLSKLFSDVGNVINKIIEWETQTKSVETAITNVKNAVQAASDTYNEHKGVIDTVVGVLLFSLIPALISVTLQMGLNLVGAIGKATFNLIAFIAEGWKSIAMLIVKTAQLALATIAFIGHTAATIAQTTATIAATAATWLFNAALAVLSAPIWLIIAAIVALIAVGVLLWKNWDWVQAKGKEVLEYLKDKWDWLHQQVLNAGGALLNAIMWPFNEAKRRIEETIKWIKDQLDFTKRHSPSVIDIVTRGVEGVNKALSGLEWNTNFTKEAAAVAVSNGGPSTRINTVQVNLDGAMIGDEAGATRLAEIVGDNIIRKLQLNLRF